MWEWGDEARRGREREGERGREREHDLSRNTFAAPKQRDWCREVSFDRCLFLLIDAFLRSTKNGPRRHRYGDLGEGVASFHVFTPLHPPGAHDFRPFLEWVVFLRFLERNGCI